MYAKTNLVKVEVLIQLLYSSKSEKVLSKYKGKKCSSPLKDISTSCFCAKLTEPHDIQEYRYLLQMSGIEVKRKINTQVKYRCLKNQLKYNNNVVAFNYSLLLANSDWMVITGKGLHVQMRGLNKEYS